MSQIMGEHPILEGTLQFPSLESLEEQITKLQRAGYLNTGEQWVEDNGKTNPVSGDYEAIDREELVIRLPEGCYRNLNRGLSGLADSATAGGIVGTIRCQRIGIIATADDGQVSVDLEQWGLSRGWDSPPSIEDEQYIPEKRDEWFRAVGKKFVDTHRAALRGEYAASDEPITV